MQLFKNLIGCLRKDNKKEKPFSKIISYEFKRSETYVDGLFCRPIIKGTFDVTSEFENGEKIKTKIIVTIDPLLSLDVYMRDSEGILYKTAISARITPVQNKNNSFCLFFERIDSSDQRYKGYGFGRLMMEAMFYTINEFAKPNKELNLEKLNFLFLYGTVSTEANDTPEKSIPLYLSFDNFSFGNYKIHVEKETLNFRDRNIKYEMVEETA